LSFKGARHDLPEEHPAFTRNLLAAIHNGQDVVIATYCAFESLECANFTKKVLTTGPPRFVQQCQLDTAYSNKVDYDKLMLRSQFSLIVPGEGLHSYRLLEAMSVRAVVSRAAVHAPFERLLSIRRAQFLLLSAAHRFLSSSSCLGKKWSCFRWGRPSYSLARVVSPLAFS
jgi:hypothetical protein